MHKLELLNEARERVKVAKLGGSSISERGEASRAYATAAEDYSTARALATSRISSTAIASGYASGIAALVLLVIPVTLLGGSLFSLRLAIGGSGLAWGLGTIRELREPGLSRLEAQVLTVIFWSQPRRFGSGHLQRWASQLGMARSSLGQASRQVGSGWGGCSKSGASCQTLSSTSPPGSCSAMVRCAPAGFDLKWC